MQMVKKTVIALVLLWFALLLFMPKIQLYYLLEHNLAKREIKLNESRISESPFGLRVTGMQVYFKGIPIAKIEKTEAVTLLFYNRISTAQITLDALLKEKFPASIEKLVFQYSLIDPLHIHISGSGSFGTLEGNYDLRAHKLHIDIAAGKDIGMIGQWLKRGEKGYYYETSF